MRKMYDSTTAADCPTDGHLVAGYVDGAYRWRDSDWALFPHAVHVRIATSPATDDGHVLDVEAGDATPEEAVAWVAGRRVAGAEPTVYCPASLWPDVRAAFTRAAVAEPHYWIARWDGISSLLAGAVAKQYANPDITGGHYDASVVADFWPGVDVAIEFVTKADFEAYKVALQAQLDATYAKKGDAPAPHTHPVTGTAA